MGRLVSEPGSNPWLSHYKTQLCAQVLGLVAAGQDPTRCLNEALHGLQNQQGLPLRCVPQSDLPSGMAYEQYIFDTGHIPTRIQAGSAGALHDACNALMWVHFPRSKALLNAMQAQAIAKDGVRAQRGQLRDALTLFDESALVVCCPADDPLGEQLARRDWLGALHARRVDWHHLLRPFVFGHAVLQKLQRPYLAITAQVYLLPIGQANSLSTVDEALSVSLSALQAAQGLTPHDFLPLPVLGIPQWWQANANADFYANRAVFRPLPTLS